jgi:hypothetical protein
VFRKEHWDDLAGQGDREGWAQSVPCGTLVDKIAIIPTYTAYFPLSCDVIEFNYQNFPTFMATWRFREV